jgi:hypothetical protein
MANLTDHVVSQLLSTWYICISRWLILITSVIAIFLMCYQYYLKFAWKKLLDDGKIKTQHQVTNTRAPNEHMDLLLLGLNFEYYQDENSQFKLPQEPKNFLAYVWKSGLIFEILILMIFPYPFYD